MGRGIVAAAAFLGTLAPGIATAQEQAPAPAPAQGQAAPGGMHGAMPMAEQVSAFDKLGPFPDVTKPPPAVDYVLWKEIVPSDNLMTPERVALGKKLYFDSRLSKDGTVACATSRRQPRLHGSAAGGMTSSAGASSPTTLNARSSSARFLHGRAPSLEGAGETADQNLDRDGPALGRRRAGDRVRPGVPAAV
jgi:cytochrome c peroxidase